MSKPIKKKQDRAGQFWGNIKRKVGQSPLESISIIGGILAGTLHFCSEANWRVIASIFSLCVSVFIWGICWKIKKVNQRTNLPKIVNILNIVLFLFVIGLILV